jgi:hypothetical protein
MKLYITGEVSESAGRGLQRAGAEITVAVNTAMSTRDYGRSIEKWYFGAIILATRLPGWFPETAEYNPDKHYVSFQRNLDHEKFVSSPHQGQCRLICESILASIKLAQNMDIPDFAFEEFKQTLVAVGVEKGWW